MPIDDILTRSDIPEDARELIRRELAARSCLETKQREGIALMAAVVDNATDLVFVKDRLGCYLLANPATLSLLGRARADVIGHDDRELFPAEVASRTLRDDGEVMRSGHPLLIEEELPSASGGSRTLLTAKVPYRDAQGRVIGVVGISRDITERSRLELENQRLLRLDGLSALAAGVSRDLEDLLGDIDGPYSAALNALPSAHPARQPLERIEHAAKRLRLLAHRLQTYSGRARLVIQPFDLCALVREHLSLLEMTVPDPIRLSADLCSCPAWIEADMGQVQQALMNLVLNGADAIGQAPGRVAVSVGFETLVGDEEPYARFTGTGPTAGRYVVLGVRDDGLGMSEATLSRAFEPFYSTKPAGHGLGLSYVLGVARAHRGGIQVRSRPGAGSEFKLAFPAPEGLDQA
jgi:two-component system, cell cycle sensor histidine kinase and response regulator CckA